MPEISPSRFLVTCAQCKAPIDRGTGRFPKRFCSKRCAGRFYQADPDLRAKRLQAEREARAQNRAGRPNGHWWHEPTRAKTCTTCGDSKPLDQFYAYSYTTKQGKQSTRYESRCKQCQRERQAARRRSDPDRCAEEVRQWREKNGAHLKTYRKSYISRPEIKQRRSMLQCARQARMKAGSPGRKDPAIIAVYVEAKRVEELASVCPVFDLPELGKKMHVDHVTPIARGGKHVADNLQILPAGINMRKWAHL